VPPPSLPYPPSLPPSTVLEQKKYNNVCKNYSNNSNDIILKLCSAVKASLFAVLESPALSAFEAFINAAVATTGTASPSSWAKGPLDGVRTQVTWGASHQAALRTDMGVSALARQ